MRTRTLRLRGSHLFIVTIEVREKYSRVELTYGPFRDHIWSESSFVIRTKLFGEFVIRMPDLTDKDIDLLRREVDLALIAMEQQHDQQD